MRKYIKVTHPLKDAIKKKYKTLDAFCDYTGITKNTMYYIFSNRNHSMRDDTKMLVMDALGIDIRELWGMLHQ